MNLHVNEYGVTGDGITLQTEKIQKLIDLCSSEGGGNVIFPRGTYRTGTLHLKSGVTLCILNGATILGSGEIEDYEENETCFTDAVGHVRGRALIYAYQAKNIGICGDGNICGRGYLFGPEHEEHLIRPFLIRLVECYDINFESIHLQQSAAWCLHIQDSKEVNIKGIQILNRCNGNNDGIDIDGCEDVVIRNCFIDSGDDAICLKSTSNHTVRHVNISNCVVRSGWAGFKVGTESVGDFEDIVVEHCQFYDIEGCAIKLVTVDGGSITGLILRDINMLNCTGPIFISTGTRLRQYFDHKKDVPGSIMDVKIERIKADVISAKGTIYQGKQWGNALGAIVISGLKKLPVTNVSIRDCEFIMPGGVLNYEEHTVPQMGDQYPEFHLFDVLPAYGMYLRDTKNVSIHNVRIKTKLDDVREMIVKEDSLDECRIG